MLRTSLILILFIPLISTSQKSSLGISGGMNLSTINTFYPESEPSSKTSYRFQVAWNTGIVYSFKVNSHIFLESGLNYNNMGAKNSENSFRYQLGYISMPMSIATEYSKFNFGLGPKISYLLSGEAVRIRDGNRANLLNVPLGYERLEIALNGFVSYELINQLHIRFFFMHGITSLRELDNNEYPEKFNNMAFQLNLKYDLLSW